MFLDYIFYYQDNEYLCLNEVVRHIRICSYRTIQQMFENLNFGGLKG